jgi:hypothetical protein
MPTPTYTPLANLTLSSAQSSVTFASLPTSGYRDLVISMNVNTTATGTSLVWYRLNGDSGANYYRQEMRANSSSQTASGDTQQSVGFIGTMNGTTIGSNRYTPINLNWLDYRQTDKHKNVLGRFSGANAIVGAFISRWQNTSAITSILIQADSGSFGAGSTFALYGIAS